jgi:1-acyl-sn-glycerol-3-phosphate acyltransferase
LYHRFLHLTFRLLLWLICRIKVVGRENIPRQGPFLAVTNHLSAVDPLLVFSLIPARLKLTGMAAMAHRSDFLIGWIMHRGGAVWVRRGESDRKALRESLEVLSSGRPLGVAPEGTRSNTGALIEGKTGVTFLALKAGVPILPFALAGTDKVFPSLLRFRRAIVEVRISPSFSLPGRGGGPRREHVQHCTDLIMTRLASTLPKPYRGVYSGHRLIGYWEQLDASGKANSPQWKRSTP